MEAALVVGGSRGLGWSLTKQLAAQGVRVHVWSRQPPPSLDGVSWTAVDLASAPPASNGGAVSFDTVFHVAARGRFLQRVEDYDPIEFQRLVSVNLVAMVSILVQSLQVLPRGGRYCYVSSLSALLPSGGWCLYGATKAGADHVVRSIRAAAMQRGVSVTLAYPGILQTDFHRHAGAPPPPNGAPPEEIAAELIQSVAAREPLYVAPMDRELIGGRLAPDRAERWAQELFPEIE